LLRIPTKSAVDSERYPTVGNRYVDVLGRDRKLGPDRDRRISGNIEVGPFGGAWPANHIIAAGIHDGLRSMTSFGFSRVACKLLLIGAMTVVIFFDFLPGARRHGYMTRSTIVDLPASVSSGRSRA
jgi:hypothetical protein